MSYSRRERSFLREDRAARSDAKRQHPAPENALSLVTHSFARGTFAGNHAGPMTSADYSKNSGWGRMCQKPSDLKDQLRCQRHKQRTASGPLQVFSIFHKKNAGASI